MAASFPKTFELPTKDRLTGLVTAPFFRHLLVENLIPAAQESGEPLSVLHMDVDDFKGFNERGGPACGDELLRSVARAMEETLPEGTVIARYSGDEFSAALPARLDDAFTLAEELRRRIRAIRPEGCAGAETSCSIGLAAYPGDGKRDVELLREADAALFQAKTSGRNKVALPRADSRMILKTSYYTATQLERLAQLAGTVERNEATLLREALDDLLKKYNDRLGGPPSAAGEKVVPRPKSPPPLGDLRPHGKGRKRGS